VYKHSALQPGLAAELAERQKTKYHAGRFDASRFQFFTAAQETFGRFGVQLSTLVKHIASHAAHVKGGTAADIAQMAVYVEYDIRSSLSVSLAKANAERVLAYVRGAQLGGSAEGP